jgi:S2P endopeptidase
LQLHGTVSRFVVFFKFQSYFRESIPMVDVGASFTICIPAAFVTFPVADLKTLVPQARSRIIAAGPFHNLVLWVFLALVTHLGLFSWAAFISGYRQISDVGQVIISVDVVSRFSSL